MLNANPPYRAYAHNITELSDLLDAYASGGGTAENSFLKQHCISGQNLIGNIGNKGERGTLDINLENGKINNNEINASITIDGTGDFSEVTPDDCSIKAQVNGERKTYNGEVHFTFVESTGTCYIVANQGSGIISGLENSKQANNVFFECSHGEETVSRDPVNINVVQKGADGF